MIDTIRKCVAMMPGGMRAQWLRLIPLTLLATVSEAGTAAAVFALFQLLDSPSQAAAIPWLAAIISRLPNQDPPMVVLQLLVLAALLYLAKTAVAIRTNYVRYRLLHEASAALSTEMLRRYLGAPYPFHFHRNSAQLIRNCTSSVGEVMGVVIGTALAAISEAMVAIAIGAVLLSAAPMLAVAAAGVLGILLFAGLRLTRKAASRLGAALHAEAALSLKTLQQALGGIKEIKILGREAYFQEAFAERQRQVLVLGNRNITVNYLPGVVMQSIMVIGGLLLIAVMTLAGGSTAATLPTVGLFGYAAMRLMPTATWLLNTVNGLRSAAQAANELYDDFVTLHPAAPTGADGGLTFRRTIALDRVSYQYPQAPAPALQGVSFTVTRGESIGIVGPTGAGKSTLVDLILGLLPPASGRLVVDGVPVGDGVTFRRRVGYVPQALFLLDDTLRRNIALGIPDREIDAARLGRVIAMAQLQEMVAALPDGVDTQVGERGVRLSGGERQRIAIARALYHDPDFLVFDEATSSLDLATEAEVTRTIDELRGDRTLLVIAHRLTTVRQCNRVIFLRAGRVDAIGTFDELCRDNPEFRALASLAAV